MTPSTPEITQLLIAWGKGDPAALDALTPLVQQELHRIAARYMAGERVGHLLQATALVNEAFIRLIDWKDVRWSDRAHFFGIASQLMRRILVDFARSRDRDKRGGGAIQISLEEAKIPKQKAAELVALDDALTTLEQLDARQCRVVEMRFFGGLSIEEIAEALGVSRATVKRDWSLAQAWLFRELNKTIGERTGFDSRTLSPGRRVISCNPGIGPFTPPIVSSERLRRRSGIAQRSGIVAGSTRPSWQLHQQFNRGRYSII